MSRSNHQTPQLVYLAFGPATYHQEACFSIVSALARLRSTPGHALHIQVYTDDAKPYEGLPVTLHLLDEQTRRRWNEPHGYHFRSKHVVLREVLTRHARAILIDTDTFFRTSPIELVRRVQAGSLLCNMLKGRYDQHPHCPLYVNLKASLEQRGLADDSMPTVNSGVIGLTEQDAAVLDRSIALMDEYYTQAEGAYTLEEFCLAVAAYRTLALNECTDVIHHYWSRKQQFRAKIQAWLRKHGADPLSEAALADVDQVSDQLPRPPLLHRLSYKAMSLTLPSHQRQFARELLYGCYAYPNEFDRASASAWWDKALENIDQRHGGLSSEQLSRCLRQPGLRLTLGARREEVERHLLAARRR